MLEGEFARVGGSQITHFAEQAPRVVGRVVPVAHRDRSRAHAAGSGTWSPRRSCRRRREGPRTGPARPPARVTTMLPSASTTRRRSGCPRSCPSLRLIQPMPPPRVKPPTPVWETTPAGVTRPCGALAPSRSPSRAPPPTRAVRAAGLMSTVAQMPRSSIRPVVAGREASHVVPTATYGQGAVEVGRDPHRIADRRRRAGLDDGARTPIDHGVPHHPAPVVLGRPGIYCLGVQSRPSKRGGKCRREHIDLPNISSVEIISLHRYSA